MIDLRQLLNRKEALQWKENSNIIGEGISQSSFAPLL